jgi:hypothetical protein
MDAAGFETSRREHVRKCHIRDVGISLTLDESNVPSLVQCTNNVHASTLSMCSIPEFAPSITYERESAPDHTASKPWT